MFISFNSRGSQAAQQLLSGSSILRGNVALSYGIGLVLFIAAVALRFGLEPAIPDFPYIPFIPAVIISAFLAGTRGGVLSAALSFLSAWYWFVDPIVPFSTSYGEIVGLGLFIFIISVDIAIIEFAARAVHEQQRTRIALEDALREKEVLLYEVNHRVKNSLQLVSSFLLLEASKIDSSEARSAVMVARNKVDIVARLHRLLYVGGTHDHVDLQATLKEIVQHLILSAGRDDVSLEFNFSGDLMMSIGQASPLVLAVNEIIMNSLKYGLSSEQPKLTVSASNTCDQMALVISDTGPGIVATTPEKNSGLGSEIIQGLVAQMRGTLAIQSDGAGTVNALTVPLKPQPSFQKGTSR